MKKLLAFVFFFVLIISYGQEEIWMRPNNGQWHENIEFKIGIPSGFLYLENGGFTYDFSSLGEEHDHKHESGTTGEPIQGHAVRTKFLGSNPNPIFEKLKPSSFYENYFIGNDSTKWVSNAFAYNEIRYLSLYPQIDLQLYESSATLKYDVVVHPGGNPADFVVAYEGQNSLTIIGDALHVETSLGTIIEGKPRAYQIINGLEKEVECFYVLENDQMSFSFPNGYDAAFDLIIDPSLTFSTFTGASSDNWGMTACPDINKNLVAAGIVFAGGYPLSVGPYDATYNGGMVDVAITKFNATGSAIVFSTFLGGDDAESPHSLVVNAANELYIFGVTASTNFPMGVGAFQSTKAGGSTFLFDGYVSFNGGSDLYVTKLSAAGNVLVGSTFIGGTGNDGVSSGSTIAFNYGDIFRGEVMVDAAGFVYITSSTESSNFPIVGGFDNSIGGTQDAIVAKFNSNLTSLLWSTYIGGTGLESGNSVQLSSTGDIFVAGGTTSSNLPNTAGTLNPTFKGGTTDGYVFKFTAPAYAAPTATYLGTNDYDQSYFVQLDIDDFVYVYGQTKGPYTVTAGHYVNANSGQFIHKLSNNLVTSQWSSVFGAGTGNEEISPTAFLVSNCYEIYVAGWGGATNVNNSTADNSTTTGFPVTSDAYMPTTNGSNFYLGLFTKDMISLKYATFMGSTTGADHVDGGTSRFDKQGGIYHAVCAACGGNANGFPTTAGVFSPTNNSTNCNMAAFQFELAKIDAVLGTGSPVICIPDPVVFDNASVNGNTYYWDFGDGQTSTDFEPTHFYAAPGTYIATLIVTDSSGCFTPDTVSVEVIIQLLEAEAGTLSDTICPGESVQLYAIGGDTYVWGPGNVLDDSTSANPIAIIWEETTFTVQVESACGSSTIDVTVHVFGANAAASPDTAICVGGTAQLFAGGGDSYLWTPPASLDDPTSANPIATPWITTTYFVEIVTPEGCHINDTTTVIVDQDLPYPNLIDEISICKGDAVQIAAHGATSYVWSPNYNITNTTIYNPVVSPIVDTSYAVSFTNACGTTYDTVDVFVIEVIGDICPDTIICPEGAATLWASGGVNYHWTPSGTLSSPHSAVTQATPNSLTQYSCLITDIYGCSTTLTTLVDVFDSPIITVSPEVYGVVGDTIGIWAEGVGTIVWSPPYYMFCVECFENFVYPPNEMEYTATLTDANGCISTGVVPIHYDPLIYVPNCFTPNNDEFNNYFQAITHNILTFEMLIFNRWGEIVYSTNSIDHMWDGTYRGALVLDDVYVWQIVYTDLNEIQNELRGHVTVLR